MDPSILIFDSPQEAAAACGDRTLEILDQARKDRGKATIAVSGGSTPRMMFEAMAERGFDWSAVEIFQVDERCVPPRNERSNFRMLQEALLHAIGIGENQIHRIHGELAPEEAAQSYEGEIRRSFDLAADQFPVFDVIQRGMGPDGHTASLFPGEPRIGDGTGIVAAVFVEQPGMEKSIQHRVTLLPGVLERARYTLCLATGAEKAEAFRRVLRGPFDRLQVPAQIASVNTVWYVDRSAAGLQ